MSSDSPDHAHDDHERGHEPPSHHHPHAADHPHHGEGPDHGHDHRSGIRGLIAGIVAPHSHDAGDSIDSALTTSAEGMRALKISLAGLGVTALFQVVIVVISGSVALLADTIHNFSDALTAIPLAFAFWLGRRPPTKRYTYGYGRAEDLAGIFIVAMIAFSAAVAGWEAVRRLLNPQDIDNVGWVVAAGVIGFAGNELVAVYRIRVGRKIGSAALIADGLHARTDGFTSLAVVAGGIGVAVGFPLADPIVGLVITAAILVVLKGAARDIYRRLMDSVDPGLVDDVVAVASSVAGVETVESVQIRWTGHELRAEIEISSDAALLLVEAHAIAEEAHHRLLHDIPRLTKATVHTSPSAGDGQEHHAAIAHHFAATHPTPEPKTGTLTEGVPRVAAVHPLASAGFDEPGMLRLAAAAELPSEHPLGRAIVAAARARDLRLPDAATFSAQPGRGITATVGDTVVTVGSPAVLDDLSAVPRDIRDIVDAIQAAGRTAVVVLVDNHPVGALALTDQLRPQAAETVERLRQLTSHEPVLLTGDNPGAANAVAADAGVTHVSAGLLPHDKVAAVRELQAQGQRVLLVGDGINDAPALATADVGIAMGHVGADLSLETADAVIVRDDLATLPAVIELSRNARRVVTQNLVIAGTVIAALVTWDLFGHLPLPLGVAGHEGSTLIVGLNGLRLLRSRAWAAPPVTQVRWAR